MKEAQVKNGGVPLEEITFSMESKLLKNLFILGDLLDSCGKCGGYNLHFAWTSGYMAAETIIKGRKQ